MAFDACMMRAVLGEFSSEFPEAKIEKVLPPNVHLAYDGLEFEV